MKTNQLIIAVQCSAKHIALLTVLLLVGLYLSGCKQATKAAVGNDNAGVYTLASVDGKKVPSSVSHEGTALQVRSGTFTLNANGTCGTRTTFVPPNGAE